MSQASSKLREQVCVVCRLIGVNVPPTEWRGIDAVWPVLEHIRTEGGVVVLKSDGQRTGVDDAPPFDVIITGPQLSGRHLRAQAHLIEDAISECVIAYAVDQWGYLG